MAFFMLNEILFITVDIIIRVMNINEVSIKKHLLGATNFAGDIVNVQVEWRGKQYDVTSSTSDDIKILMLTPSQSNRRVMLNLYSNAKRFFVCLFFCLFLFCLFVFVFVLVLICFVSFWFVLFCFVLVFLLFVFVCLFVFFFVLFCFVLFCFFVAFSHVRLF